MAQKLSRSKLAQVCKAFDGGEFGARSLKETPAATIFFIKNAGSSSINEGAPLSITNFATSGLAFDKAAARLNNGALVLSAVSASGNVHAIAIDRVAPGQIGRATSVGLCLHRVTINASADEYASAAFSSTSTADFYKILAKSATSNGAAICALYHEQASYSTQTITYIQSVSTDDASGALVFNTQARTVLMP